MKPEEKPKKSFQYSALTIPTEWPARNIVTEKLMPRGNPAYLPGEVLYYNFLVPQNQFWRQVVYYSIRSVIV